MIIEKKADQADVMVGCCDVFVDLNMAKIRYSRTDGKLKNTLYTIKMGSHLVFGISRCKLNSDTFSKKEGRHLARERAVRAYEAYHERSEMMIFAEDGLSGQVRADLVNVVLDYFYNIEENETPQEAREKERAAENIEKEASRIMANVKASMATLVNRPLFSTKSEPTFQVDISTV